MKFTSIKKQLKSNYFLLLIYASYFSVLFTQVTYSEDLNSFCQVMKVEVTRLECPHPTTQAHHRGYRSEDYTSAKENIS